AHRAGAQPRHGAGGLVAEGERQRERNRACGPLGHVQIAVAEARALDLDQHLARPRLGNGDLDELGLALPTLKTDGAHSWEVRRLRSADANADRRRIGGRWLTRPY